MVGLGFIAVSSVRFCLHFENAAKAPARESGDFLKSQPGEALAAGSPGLGAR